MTRPEVPASFHWTDETWGTALRCRPLEPIAPHLFTTRQLELPSGAAWRALATAIGVPPERVVSLNQVHGREVVTVRRNVAADALRAMQAERPQADALVSDAPDVALVVRAADCVPLLIGDSRTGTVAAVHAGWRGTAAGVAAAAIGALARGFGSRPGDLVVPVGPAIGPCCYEVRPDLVDAVAAARHERYLIERWFMTPRDQKMRLHVPGSNRDQLILAGAPEGNIHGGGLWT